MIGKSKHVHTETCRQITKNSITLSRGQQTHWVFAYTDGSCISWHIQTLEADDHIYIMWTHAATAIKLKHISDQVKP